MERRCSQILYELVRSNKYYNLPRCIDQPAWTDTFSIASELYTWKNTRHAIAALGNITQATSRIFAVVWAEPQMIYPIKCQTEYQKLLTTIRYEICTTLSKMVSRKGPQK